MPSPCLVLSVLAFSSLCLQLVEAAGTLPLVRCNDGSSTYVASSCCRWTKDANNDLVRDGTCSSATQEIIDLSVIGIDSIKDPPSAFADCGSPKVLNLMNNSITSISLVQFPATLRVLDLALNKIDDISGAKFPGKLSHLSLKGNIIQSIAGVNITLGCNPGDGGSTITDECSAVGGYAINTVDLSGNLLTSIAGARFSGSIVTLDLSGIVETPANTTFQSLPIGATFPDSLTSLQFTLDSTKVWTSGLYCTPNLQPAPTPDEKSAIDFTNFNPKTCCMWGGKKIGSVRALERIGTCTGATYPSDILDLSNNNITAIPPNAFANIGSPKVIKLNQNKLISIDGVVFPTSIIHLQIQENELSSLPTNMPSSLLFLDLKKNNIESLNNVQFPQLSYLNLEANKISSVSPSTFPTSLTYLTLKNNKLMSVSGVQFVLKDFGGTYWDTGTSNAPKKFLSLEQNYLASLQGATFQGIEILDLDSSPDSPETNTIQSLGDVTFPASLRGLYFGKIIPPLYGSHWSVQVCDNGVNSSISLPHENLHQCCIWFGNTAGAPLERIGTCTTANYTSTSLTLDLSAKGITAIPANAFTNCGAKETLKLNGNMLTTLSGTVLPNSLKILYAHNNKIATLSGLTGLNSLSFLFLSNNQLTSVTGTEFPITLTHLDLKNNRITLPRAAEFRLKACEGRATGQCPSPFPQNLQNTAVALDKFLDLSYNLIQSLDEVKFAFNFDGDIPPPFTWELHLQRNSISLLRDVSFPFSLKKLYLQWNKIVSLEGVGLPDNFKLTHLDLQYNALTSIPTTLFTKMPILSELYLNNNKISSLNVTLPAGLTKLNLQNNQIASLKAVSIPNTVTHLYLGGTNPMIVFDVVIDISGSTPAEKSALTVTGSVLDLPASLRCIPGLALRGWVATTNNSATAFNVYPSCMWAVTKCNTVEGTLKFPKAGSTNLNPDASGNLIQVDGNGNLIMPDNTNECCIWYGSYLGGTLNRTGECSLAVYTPTAGGGDHDGGIVLSNKAITAISPGAFDKCGQPLSLTLAKNRIASLSVAGGGVVAFPTSLTHLDLSENKLTSLSGVSFALDNCGPAPLVTCEVDAHRRFLNLKKNELTSLDGVTFVTESLKLDLTENKLASLKGIAFPKSMRELDLSANRIATLDSVTFDFTGCKKLSLGNNMIVSFAGAKFLGSIRELGLNNVNKNGVTSLAGVTFDLQLGDPDWVCSGLVPESECALPGNGSLIAGVLDMHDNRITSVAGARFSGSIDKLDLSGNGIASLEGATFHLLDCILLNLEKNEIKSLAGATFAGTIRQVKLNNNDILSLAGATFSGSIANLDLNANKITSLAGVAFNFLKCAVVFEKITGGCNVSYPLINLANNKISSFQGATFSGFIGTLDLVDNAIQSFAGATFSGLIGTIDLKRNKVTSLAGLETFTGIKTLILGTSSAQLHIQPSGLDGVTLPPKSLLGAITGLSVSTCVPSQILQKRLNEDYSTQGNLCEQSFWTRCEPDATVEERCPPARRSASSSNTPSSVTSSSSTSESPDVWKRIVGVVSSLVAMATGKPVSDSRGTRAQLRTHNPISWKWNPSCLSGVPTNTAQCCIWSQAFPGAPLLRVGSCAKAVGGGLDFSGLGLAAILPGTFDNVGSPQFLNLENNKLTSIDGVSLPDKLQALFLNDNKLASLTGVTFPTTLQVLHLHDNADLACVPMPKGFVDSPTYSGPDACKVITTPPPSPPKTTTRPPSTPPPPPSTTTLPPSPVVKTDTFVQLVVALPYTKASFDQDKQLKFRTALASSAGTTAENVEIVSITEGRRRQGSGIKVENKIYAKDAASADKLSSTLGTGSGALDKINSELQKQGLEKSTGLDVVSATKSDNTGLIVGLVVGLGGGAIIIVAIAAYYLYVVKPAAQLPPKTRDLENAPVAAPSAPIVAPAASLGVPSPARMPAPSTLVFDAYDFTNWSKSGAPGYQNNQPGYQSNQPQYGAMPRFNM